MVLHTLLLWLARQDATSLTTDPGFDMPTNVTLSNLAGTLSIICWFIVFTPQLWTNYNRQSGESLSLPFLFIWLAGDIFNIVGATMDNLLLTMRILAWYYTLADALLIAQVYYYRRVNRQRDSRKILDAEREEEQDQHGYSHHSASLSSAESTIKETSSLLSKTSNQDTLNYSSINNYSVIAPSTSSSSSFTVPPSCYLPSQLQCSPEQELEQQQQERICHSHLSTHSSAESRLSPASEGIRSLGNRRRIRKFVVFLILVFLVSFFVWSFLEWRQCVLDESEEGANKEIDGSWDRALCRRGRGHGHGKLPPPHQPICSLGNVAEDGDLLQQPRPNMLGDHTALETRVVLNRLAVVEHSTGYSIAGDSPSSTMPCVSHSRIGDVDGISDGGSEDGADKGDDGSDEGVGGPLALYFGWGSALLYLGSRIPQIYKNWRLQSCEGLSILMFKFSVLGNVLFVASIFLNSTDPDYLWRNMPWWLGSTGTLIFDITIFAQFFLYRPRKLVEDSER